MIRIDHISFEFVAPDETFAHGLYAGWDDFCRDCFEQVVEECCTAYDKERVLHEIERLELDLGGIPEEEFYREFPLRLKEELLKALSSLDMHILDEAEKSDVSRRDNLLFFLEHGFPKPEWEDGNFNPSAEAGWLLLQSLEIRQAFITAAARLCLEQGYALRRLLWQTDNVEMHLGVYAAALAESSAGIWEKHRLLVLMLEAKPDIPVRFVHRAGSDGELQGMAALLDSPSVWCLMRTEAREHAEVDIPPYWHYLYEWLIRYYPFNGLAIFGGKAEFTRHLHHRLLAFIRKRKDSPYLSKTELTLDFLLEVFGPVYYKEVLNAIYELQPRNADESPMCDGYLNRELYRIFMQLSLLELPGIEKEETGKEETFSPDMPSDIEKLADILKESTRSDAVVETWIGKLNRRENLSSQSDGDEAETAFIYRLQKILSDTTLPEAVKQRATIAFWEAYREDYAKAIILLQAQQLLSEVIELTHKSVKEEIIRRQTMQVFGTEQAEVLLSLFVWLVEHGAELPSMQKAAAESLEAGLFYWMATRMQGRDVTAADAIRSLFATLWDASELPAVFKKISESITIGEEAYIPETLLALLEEAGNKGRDIRLSVFHEWLHRQEMLSNAVQTMFKKYWNTAENLAKWLEDGSMPTGYKRELLRTVITEYTEEWMALLRNTAQTGKTFETLTGYLSVPVLRQGMAKTNFYQASVLSRMSDRIEHHADAFPFLAASGASLSYALSKALLRYMQDADTLTRTLTEKEIIEKFLSVLYTIIYEGKTGSDYRNDTGWKQLAAKVMPEAEQQEIVEPMKQKIIEILSDRTLSETKVQGTIQTLVERHPGKLLSWLEEDVGIEEIHRMAEVANIAILERWVEYLSTVTGFVNADAFRRLAMWLLRSLSDKYSTVALATALFAWMKEAGWKRQTPRQMEDYFFARLLGGSNGDIPLSVKNLAQEDLPDTIRKRLLRHFLRFRPKELSVYIRRSVAEDSVPLTLWTEWLNAEDWRILAASFSLSATELLWQVTEVLHLDEQTCRQVWSICLTTGNKKEEWTYNSSEENIRSFVQAVVSVQGQDEAEIEIIVRRIEEELHLRKEEVPDLDDVPEFFPVGNAGLCLLSPWLVRLFGMLGYLDEEKKKLKDTASKIRAVFLLQYLVHGEEREYRETELSFNRLLAGLSRHVSLPKRLTLTDDEKQTADSMLTGVKANWQKLKGTSVEGFRRSFIARNGTLERQDERWLLTVEKKTHDILLESVPWSFRQIRLPWLKKYIQVIWNEKQEFG